MTSSRVQLFFTSAAAALIFVLLSGPAVAGSWYVDNATHGGADNGTSWANAWTSFAGVDWSRIQPGDTVYVSGGAASQTYKDSWSVGASGTAANPITIAVGQDAGHSGKVVFDFDADGDASTRTAITVMQNYVTFDGSVAGENHFQLNNLRNVTDRRAPVGIYGSSNVGVTIEHFTFINDNNPIRLDYANGVTIRDCSFQGVRGDAAIALKASKGSWDANRVYGNQIETLQNPAAPPGGSGPYGGPDGIQGGDGLAIYDNVIRESRASVYTSSQHPDMMQITGNYVRAHDNEFINCGDSVRRLLREPEPARYLGIQQRLPDRDRDRSLSGVLSSLHLHGRRTVDQEREDHEQRHRGCHQHERHSDGFFQGKPFGVGRRDQEQYLLQLGGRGERRRGSHR